MKLAMYLLTAIILFFILDGFSSWVKLPSKSEINETTCEYVISRLGTPYEVAEEKYISWRVDGFLFSTILYISYTNLSNPTKCKFIKKKLFINIFSLVAIFEHH